MSGEYANKFQIDLKIPEKFSDIEFTLDNISDLSLLEKKNFQIF